jgi:phosphoglycerate dehydrogenase-like enzyme
MVNSGRAVIVFLDLVFQGTVRELMTDLDRRATVVSGLGVSPDALAAARQEAVACVSRFFPLTAADLAGMPKLRMISAWGVGYNHIDVAAATARGIPVCINPVFSRSMAEAALTLMLALSKNLPRRMRQAREGAPVADSDRGFEIRGRTVGVVGFGRIGDLAHRLDMHVIAADPYLPAASWPAWCGRRELSDLLGESDFVVLAAPLAAGTRHLIGENQIALMKPTAFLINIARGPLLDERALFEALRARRIAGAGLDVWEHEPVDPGHPLLTLENVIGTPHRLGATEESLQALCAHLQANLLRALSGRRPENAVNPAVFEGAAR